MKLIKKRECEILLDYLGCDGKWLSAIFTNVLRIGPRNIFLNEKQYLKLLKLQDEGIVREDCPSEQYQSFRVLDHSRLPEWLQAFIRRDVKEMVVEALEFKRAQRLISPLFKEVLAETAG